MNQRRVFLQVLGASALTTACGSSDTESETTTGATTSGTGGSGGAGGASSADAASSSTASASSADAASSSTGSGGGLPANYTAVGKVADITTGLLKPVASVSLLLGRDAGGVYAMSSLCTHKFCDMCVKGTINMSGVVCTCHNSKFDGNGAVTQGPALKPLDHYDCLVLDDGTIGVDKTKIVAADFRAMVP